MDSLTSILSGKNFDEPPEVSAIKKYVLDKYGASVGIRVRERDLVIIVPSAALANTLRLAGPELKRRCQVDKRLTFQIGS
jgi:hypothetical protein